MVLTKKDLKFLEDKSFELIKKADRMILEGFQKDKTIKNKDIRDISTNIDVSVEEFLKDKLKELLPEAGFIIEEGKSTPSNEYNWVIDPIDGTKYYSGKVPMVITQIGLLYKNKSILGLCSNPFTGDIFSASLGNNTKINKKIVKLDMKKTPNESIVDCDFGGLDQNIDSKIELFRYLVNNFYRVRITAGFLHPYLITGAIDVIVTYLKDRTQKKEKFTIDYSPRFILYEELGFVKKDFIFKNLPIMVISSKDLMNSFVKNYEQFKPI
ncbi:MAG: Inositol monophosphatase [Candidatus Roizmanbacteria bacterium GW2011_GWC2_37_13]|uniref:Inositol monophosphatase n=1 Tax=Candidatus Roizmanbacteria bacterium GW2011_GWC2_37_13 TaxID=1618486 RepID=A0A0G0GI06_9BACT|nr:MAG: Inositol monophosphatase [Candidatus Roizmanbacteria bacterium GW2011_GWC1_37_12]KKQ25730.1 MAG: Inositol monophosphatase [Candidatus Roizmanbacteria bacterium GW2011_GWC2_37_13]